MKNLVLLLLTACIIGCSSQSENRFDKALPSPERIRSNNVLDSVIVTPDGALHFFSTSAYFSIADNLLYRI